MQGPEEAEESFLGEVAKNEGRQTAEVISAELNVFFLASWFLPC